MRKGGKLVQAKKYRIFFACVTMLIPLLFTGCASVISQGVLKEVDQTLSFEQLLKSPEAHKGKTVLLGGNIIETENFSDKTVIIVLQRSLGYGKKPTSKDVSKGRFIISIPGFLDPAIYRQGRKITVVGAVAGKETRLLGEREYTYPIVAKRELHIWPQETPYDTKPRVRFGVGVGMHF